MKMTNIIYALVDPRNELIYYVGKSSVGERKPLTHLFQSHSDAVNEWIAEMGEHWFYPEIVVIEKVEDLNDLPDRERYWIDHYSQMNPEILNVNSVNKDHINYDIISKEEMETFQIISSSIGNIENILKKQRVARNLSQEDIAHHMGISRSTVSLFERGENVNIDILKKYNLSLRVFDIKSKIVNKQRSGRKQE